MRSSTFNLTEEIIAKHLAEVQDDPPLSGYPAGFLKESPQPAAVLIPLLHQGDSWHVLFTRRTDTLPEHSGQVAFPGGRSDPEDPSPEVTALREAEEEIDLKPQDVRLLGRLNGLITVTNYSVTPVVGVIPWPYSFRLASEEVSRVFTIPMSWLADPTNHEIQPRPLPSPFSPVPVIYFKIYDGELLWGVTARIVLNLLKALKLMEM